MPICLQKNHLTHCWGQPRSGRRVSVPGRVRVQIACLTIPGQPSWQANKELHGLCNPRKKRATPLPPAQRPDQRPHIVRASPVRQRAMAQPNVDGLDDKEDREPGEGKEVERPGQHETECGQADAQEDERGGPPGPNVGATFELAHKVKGGH